MTNIENVWVWFAKLELNLFLWKRKEKSTSHKKTKKLKLTFKWICRFFLAKISLKLRLDSLFAIWDFLQINSCSLDPTTNYETTELFIPFFVFRFGWRSYEKWKLIGDSKLVVGIAQKMLLAIRKTLIVKKENWEHTLAGTFPK